MQIKPLHVAVIATLIATPLQAEEAGIASTGKEAILPEVAVNAEADKESPTGPVDGYIAQRSASGTKTDTAIMETPQSISVVGQQQMQDQGALNLQDAMNYTVGVTAGAYGVDNRGDWMLVRGIEHTQFYDGLRVHSQTYDIPRPDPFMLERVEALRGPSSVLFGQGSPGGLVNIVSKRPQAESKRELVFQYGSYDRKQVGLDVTGKATEDGELLYRLVALTRDTDTQTDHTDQQRYQIAPSLTWNLSDRTSLTVMANFQRDNTNGATSAFPPHSGTVLSNPNGKIPINRFTGEPGYDQYHMESNSIGWQFEHAFNNTWTVRQNTRYSMIDLDYKSLYPNIFLGVGSTAFFVNPKLSDVTRFGYANQAQTKTLGMDNQLQARFATGDIAHTVLFGVDYLNVDIDEKNGFGFISTPFNLFNPVYGNFNRAELPVTSDKPDVENEQVGFYVQDQINLDQHWSVTAGLRRDRATNKLEGQDGQTDHATSGRLGLVYLADNGLAPYISYSESFNPTIGTNFFGQLYSPRRGKQTEVGLRYQPIGSNNRYTVSTYQLTETNRLSSDPTNPLNQIQKGEADIWGVELEALSSLTSRLDLIGNYAYTHARTNQGSGAKDQYVAEVREHVASVWMTYRFSIGDIDGFKIGAGTRYLGESNDETNTLHLPSVTLFDAMASYENKDWRLSINGTNITDKQYFATVLSRGDSWYAARGNVVASVAYKF